MAPISGYVFRYEGKRRPVWRAKYRLPDGRQGKETIGPAWTERGRPPAAFYEPPPHGVGVFPDDKPATLFVAVECGARLPVAE